MSLDPEQNRKVLSGRVSKTRKALSGCSETRETARPQTSQKRRTVSLEVRRECTSAATLARAKLIRIAGQTRAQRLARKIAQIMCENTRVNFRISDIYIPEPTQVLMELHGKDLLEGKIIDLSDSGSQEDPYAVVEVEGLSQPVVVAMRHIKGVHSE